MSKEEANNVVYTCSEHSMDMYFKVKEFEKKPEARITSTYDSRMTNSSSRCG